MEPNGTHSIDNVSYDIDKESDKSGGEGALEGGDSFNNFIINR